jgi:hypothetical protein
MAAFFMTLSMLTINCVRVDGWVVRMLLHWSLPSSLLVNSEPFPPPAVINVGNQSVTCISWKKSLYKIVRILNALDCSPVDSTEQVLHVSLPPDDVKAEPTSEMCGKNLIDMLVQ